MRVVYRGPGDGLELDGQRFEAGATVDVTAGQYTRMRVSDPLAVVEIVATGGDEDKILRDQARSREKALRELRRAENDAQAERDREQAEAEARARKEAEEADARATKQQMERAKMRADVAAGATRKGA